MVKQQSKIKNSLVFFGIFSLLLRCLQHAVQNPLGNHVSSFEKDIRIAEAAAIRESKSREENRFGDGLNFSKSISSVGSSWEILPDEYLDQYFTPAEILGLKNKIVGTLGIPKTLGGGKPVHAVRTLTYTAGGVIGQTQRNH